MAQKWIGCVVSVDCGELGVYQGEVSDMNTETLLLKKAFKNGVPCHQLEVTLSAKTIRNVTILEDTLDHPKPAHSSITVSVKKPIPKRSHRSVSESLVGNKSSTSNRVPLVPTVIATSEATNKPAILDDNLLSSQTSFLFGEVNRTPNKKDRMRQKWSEKDEACFGGRLQDALAQDFDFEKNLALFNKKAVYDEINASQRPDVVRQTDRSVSYRHDENVLSNTPPKYRQMSVPAPGLREYITDDGLVIPSVSSELRHQLLSTAEDQGLTFERQAEMMGRAATDMALHLLGGAHRLNPRNIHQRPLVVVMSGSHRPGAMGVNTARQLVSHGVQTLVYLMDPMHFTAHLAHELVLYKLTGNNTVTSNVEELPRGAVDLIVMALADERTKQLHQLAAHWAAESRAPLLALDPPAAGTPSLPAVKLSLLPALPLSHSPTNGKLYLCNLAIPDQLFAEVGIRYRSPFGPKFVIPLHPND